MMRNAKFELHQKTDEANAETDQMDHEGQEQQEPPSPPLRQQTPTPDAEATSPSDTRLCAHWSHWSHWRRDLLDVNRDVYLREVIAANLYLTSLDVSFSGFVQPWLDKVKILDHSLHQ